MPPQWPADTRLADLSEEEVLAATLPAFGAPPSTVSVPPGDDAAVLAAPDGRVVATTDSMVRGRDWRDDWSTPQDVGRKLVAQNVADVAAMGARPTGLLVAIACDPATPLSWVVGLGEGVAYAASRAGCAVVGGDLSSAPPGVVIVAVTALGDLEGRDPVVRSGAQVGDVVAASGPLGRSGAGLVQLLAGETGGPDDLRAWHRAPVCDVEAGVLAARSGASSMIDISDGLVRDLGRVARASGVTVALDGEALRARLVAGPVAEGVGEEEGLRQVLAGGEEHTLVATFAPGDVPAGWVEIGTVAEGEPGVTLNGAVPEVTGWDHFRG